MVQGLKILGILQLYFKIHINADNYINFVSRLYIKDYFKKSPGPQCYHQLHINQHHMYASNSCGSAKDKLVDCDE